MTLSASPSSSSLIWPRPVAFFLLLLLSPSSPGKTGASFSSPPPLAPSLETIAGSSPCRPLPPFAQLSERRRRRRRRQRRRKEEQGGRGWERSELETGEEKRKEVGRKKKGGLYTHVQSCNIHGTITQYAQFKLLVVIHTVHRNGGCAEWIATLEKPETQT